MAYRMYFHRGSGHVPNQCQKMSKVFQMFHFNPCFCVLLHSGGTHDCPFAPALRTQACSPKVTLSETLLHTYSASFCEPSVAYPHFPFAVFMCWHFWQ